MGNCCARSIEPWQTQEQKSSPLSNNPRITNTSAYTVQTKVYLLWTKKATALYGQVSTNVLREVCEFFGILPLFSFVHTDGICVLDVVNGKMWKELIEITQDYCPAYRTVECICVGNHQYFICGYIVMGISSISTTFLIDKGHPIKLENMKKRREKGHALYYDETTQSVYAFGGIKKKAAVRSSERFSFIDMRWTIMPKMTARRDNFNACEYERKLYLCGGGARSCEVFDLSTLQISVLPDFQFPEGRCVFSAVWDGRLYLLCQEEWKCWGLQSGEFGEKMRISGDALNCNCALQIGECIYLFNKLPNKCVCVELETARVRSIVTFKKY